MSNILIPDEQRRLLELAIAELDLSWGEGAQARSVSILDRPPPGWVVEERYLPALYVHSDGERITYLDLNDAERTHAIDVVIMAPPGADAFDALAAFQLAIERGVYEATQDPEALGAVCTTCRLGAVTNLRDKGGVPLGVRVLSYELTASVTADDPSL